MFGALVMKDLTLNNAQSFSFLHLMKMTLDEYVLLVMETQTDKLRDGQLQKNLQIHMKNAEEIKMSAKIRTQANKLLTSPKARKRKVEDQGESGDEIEPTVRSEENCTSFHTPPASASCYEPVSGTAFSRPLPLNQAPRDIPGTEPAPPVTSQCSDLLRPATLNSNPLALSPMKPYPGYERSPYLPAPFSFNSYGDYVNHTSFGPQRQAQAFPDPPAPPAAAQPFHPMTFNSGVSSAPTPAAAYWADARGHHTALADPYSQLGYGSYQQTYDTYKKTSLLRESMYRDALPRPAAASDGLSRTGATLDGLTRANPLLDSLSRPPPSFEASRSAMYYARPSDNYQVGSSLAVGSYGNSFMEITPPSGQYHRQDGLFYQEDVFTSNMATATGLTGFSKSYLPAGFR
ncbi:unnamed protein product [Lymnaea stagnalis]|uniref:RFX1-4/6/8-like BCD domain-containing protein n=1 Tax=Lymnaea stagnalis TaxID=6523 RepID=A0AAV2ICM0_LYMST